MHFEYFSYCGRPWIRSCSSIFWSLYYNQDGWAPKRLQPSASSGRGLGGHAAWCLSCLSCVRQRICPQEGELRHALCILPRRKVWVTQPHHLDTPSQRDTTCYTTRTYTLTRSGNRSGMTTPESPTTLSSVVRRLVFVSIATTPIHNNVEFTGPLHIPLPRALPIKNRRRVSDHHKMNTSYNVVTSCATEI